MSEQNQTQTESAIKLRLPADFKSEIEEAAESMHISVSALTRLALAEYIQARSRSKEGAA